MSVSYMRFLFLTRVNRYRVKEIYLCRGNVCKPAKFTVHTVLAYFVVMPQEEHKLEVDVVNILYNVRKTKKGLHGAVSSAQVITAAQICRSVSVNAIYCDAGHMHHTSLVLPQTCLQRF